MKILLLGSHTTGDDLVDKKPFGGFSGLLLDEALQKAGITAQVDRLKVFPDSQIYQHFGKAEGSSFPRYKYGYVNPLYEKYLIETRGLIASAHYDHIIAFGHLPLWFLTGSNALNKLRGVFQRTPYGLVMPTHAPEDVVKMWDLKPIFEADIAKAGRPYKQQDHFVWVADKVEDFCIFREKVKDSIAVDVETAGSQITCIGFSPSPNMAFVIPFRTSKGHHWSLQDEVKAWEFIHNLLTSKYRKIFHNGSYDLQYLAKHGIMVKKPYDDTMLMHHSMQPEMLKSLGFLSSLHLSEGAWKTLRPKKKDINKSDE